MYRYIVHTWWRIYQRLWETKRMDLLPSFFIQKKRKRPSTNKKRNSFSLFSEKNHEFGLGHCRPNGMWIVFWFLALKSWLFQGHQSWRGHFCGRTRGHRTQSHHITLLSELSQGIETERFPMSQMQFASLRRNVRFWRRTHERMLYFF